MAYIDRLTDAEFPFSCTFSRVTINERKPLDERFPTTEIVLETMCDISAASHGMTDNFISSKFVVSIPWDSSQDIPVKSGDHFEANMLGVEVNGRVVGVFPSRLNGFTVYIQDNDA